MTGTPKISFASTTGIKQPVCLSASSAKIYQSLVSYSGFITTRAMESLISNLSNESKINDIKTLINKGLTKISMYEFPPPVAFQSAKRLGLAFATNQDIGFICLQEEIHELETTGQAERVNDLITLEKEIPEIMEIQDADRNAETLMQNFDPSIIGFSKTAYDEEARGFPITLGGLSLYLIQTGMEYATGLYWLYQSLYKTTPWEQSGAENLFIAPGIKNFTEGLMYTDEFHSLPTIVDVILPVPIPENPDISTPPGFIKAVCHDGAFAFNVQNNGALIEKTIIMPQSYADYIHFQNVARENALKSAIYAFSPVNDAKKASQGMETGEMFVFATPFILEGSGENVNFDFDPDRDPLIFRILRIGVDKHTTPGRFKEKVFTAAFRWQGSMIS